MRMLIVGAGFAGATAARVLAERGARVTVVDRRDHTGGNAHDCYNQQGILIHPYGPHIFHTNSVKVFEFLSRFTHWRYYRHRVLSSVDGQLVPWPINRTTINLLYGLNLGTDQAMQDFLDSVKVKVSDIKDSESLILSQVGSDLCEKFFRNYTRKQWGLDLKDLAATVASRVPVRVSDNLEFFDDQYQFMPSQGYHTLFNNLLDHINIEVRLGIDFLADRSRFAYDHLVYTGPIDAFFDYCHGPLPYRSLEFQHEYVDAAEYQPVAVVNYPNDYDYTRITEFKHLTGQQHPGTAIVKEFPSAQGDPYYPVMTPKNQDLYRRYQDLAQESKNLTFVGRLAQYRYYNMDQAVAAALAAVEKIQW